MNGQHGIVLSDHLGSEESLNIYTFNDNPYNKERSHTENQATAKDKL